MILQMHILIDVLLDYNKGNVINKFLNCGKNIFSIADMVAIKRLQPTWVPSRVEEASSRSFVVVGASSFQVSAIRHYFLPLTIYATAPTAINPQ